MTPEALAVHLKDLYLCEEDISFLFRVEPYLDRIPDPFDEFYDEVADHALYRALKIGDYQQIRNTVGILRTGTATRPMARLARAVLRLAEGQVKEVCDFLLNFDHRPVHGKHLAGWLEEVVPELLVLTEPPTRSGSGILSLSQPIKDYHRFEEALWREGRLPQKVGLRTTTGRLLWEFHRILQQYFQVKVYRPGFIKVQKADAILQQARKSVPFHGKLFAAVADRLLLFKRLLVLERSLGRKPNPERKRWLQEFLATNHHLLGHLLEETPPEILRYLDSAWRLRWHELLEACDATFDEAQWSTLYAHHPQVFCHHLTPSLEEFEQAMLCLQMDRLLRGEEYRALAHVLLQQGNKDSLRADQLARFWACELWALKRVDNPSDSVVVRLGEMANALARRLEPGDRSDIARFLRGETLALAYLSGFSQPLVPLAEALLKILPGDLGLLMVGLASALVGGDTRARRRLEAGFVGKSFSTQELAAVHSLVRSVARLPAPHALAVLREVCVCCGESQASVNLLRLEIRQVLLEGLWLVAEEPRHRTRLDLLRHLQEDVKSYRSLLGRTLDLEGAEVVLTCWRSRVVNLEPAQRFFDCFASLEAPLVVFCYLARASPNAHASIDCLRAFSISKLTAQFHRGWPVWEPAIPLLALRCSSAEKERLCERMEGLLDGGSVEEIHALQFALKRLRSGRGVLEAPVWEWIPSDPPPPREEPVTAHEQCGRTVAAYGWLKLAQDAPHEAIMRAYHDLLLSHPQKLHPRRHAEIERAYRQLKTLEQCMRDAMGNPERTLRILLKPPAMKLDPETRPARPAVSLCSEDFEVLLGPWRRELLWQILAY